MLSTPYLTEPVNTGANAEFLTTATLRRTCTAWDAGTVRYTAPETGRYHVWYRSVVTTDDGSAVGYGSPVSRWYRVNLRDVDDGDAIVLDNYLWGRNTMATSANAVVELTGGNRYRWVRDFTGASASTGDFVFQIELVLYYIGPDP